MRSCSLLSDRTRFGSWIRRGSDLGSGHLDGGTNFFSSKKRCSLAVNVNGLPQFRQSSCRFAPVALNSPRCCEVAGEDPDFDPGFDPAFDPGVDPALDSAFDPTLDPALDPARFRSVRTSASISS